MPFKVTQGWVIGKLPVGVVTCFVFYDIIDSWHEKSKNPKKREREKEKMMYTSECIWRDNEGAKHD